MMLYTLLTGVSEILAGIVFLITAFFVYKRDSSYDLNRLVSLAFIAFSALLVSEGLMYLLQSTDSMLINLFRDITEISGVIAAVFILFAGIEVKKGKFWRELQILVPVLSVMLVNIIAVAFHHVYYKVIDGDYFYYYQGSFEWITLLVSGIPLVLLVISTYLFDTVRRSISLENDDTKVRRKLLFLEICMIFIIFSASFLVAILTIFAPASETPDIFLVLLGEFGYIISSIFTFMAFKK